MNNNLQLTYSSSYQVSYNAGVQSVRAESKTSLKHMYRKIILKKVLLAYLLLLNAIVFAQIPTGFKPAKDTAAFNQLRSTLQNSTQIAPGNLITVRYSGDTKVTGDYRVVIGNVCGGIARAVLQFHIHAHPELLDIPIIPLK